MEIPNFDSFLPQEGFKIRVNDVAGVDLYSEMNDQDSLGEDDERPPEFTSHLFRSNDLNISYMESEPGGVLDWHTHTPHMYQINMPVTGQVEISYKDENGNVHTTEAGPGEMIYLPPGAHNKVKAISEDTLRLYVIYRQIIVPQVEQMVGESDQHSETNPGLEIDTLRGIIHEKQEQAVDRF
ncbi:hypothetical protein [Haladaptatus sp. NG-WS-4]